MDWLAAICSLAGTYLVGRKLAIGWLVAAAGNVLWAAIGLQSAIYGMTAVNAIIGGVACWNAASWWKKK